MNVISTRVILSKYVMASEAVDGFFNPGNMNSTEAYEACLKNALISHNNHHKLYLLVKNKNVKR